MKAIGAPPRAIVALDDCLLDAQCNADAQNLNTAHMLDRFKEVFADGLVDERDTEAVLDLFRHTRLEHSLNEEQDSLLRWSRSHCVAVVRLVERLRTRIQTRERAALASGSQANTPSPS